MERRENIFYQTDYFSPNNFILLEFLTLTGTVAPLQLQLKGVVTQDSQLESILSRWVKSYFKRARNTFFSGFSTLISADAEAFLTWCR